MRPMRALAVLVCSLILSACAGLSSPGHPDDPAAQTQRQDNFQRSGRFALSVLHSNDQREAVQGGFSWHDQHQGLQLDLRNPMGATLARVYTQKGMALLVYSDGRQEQASTPDQLVELALGSPIPVAGLRDWIQGLANPQARLDKARYDDQGRLIELEQEGWRVTLSRYDDKGPRLLQMNRHEAARSISARLVIDQ